MTKVAADDGFRPYRTVMTIRLSHKVVDLDEDATHWEQYRELAAYLRSLRATGWKIDGLETIDEDLAEDDAN
jgi:hypothetical protein